MDRRFADISPIIIKLAKFVFIYDDIPIKVAGYSAQQRLYNVALLNNWRFIHGINIIIDRK